VPSEDSERLLKEISVPGEASESLIEEIFAVDSDTSGGLDKIAHLMEGTAESKDILEEIKKISTPGKVSKEMIKDVFQKINAALCKPGEASHRNLIKMIIEVIIRQIHEKDCIMMHKAPLSEPIAKKTHKSSSEQHSTSSSGVLSGKKTLINRALNWRLPQTSKKQSLPEERPSLERKGTSIKYMYHWLYLSFFTLWYRAEGSQNSTQILLCFDDARGERIEDAVQGCFQDPANKDLEKSPYAILDRLVEAVGRIYDEALWGYRTPIRQIEKVRVPTPHL
jgi:hypothetical protein